MVRVAIDVVTVAANTTSGIQNIALSLGGATPKGVLIFAGRGITLGTLADGACISVGMCDGTNQRVAVGFAEDNVATGNADTGRRFDSGKIVQICVAGTEALDGEAGFSSFSADNVAIDWTDPPTTAIQLIVVAFYGDIVQCYVNSYAGAIVENDPVTITGIPFTPRAAFFASALNGFSAGGSAQNLALSFGAVAFDDDGTILQGGTGLFANDRRAVSTSCTNIIRNDSILQRMSATLGVGNEDVRHEVTARTADGFVVTTRDSAPLAMAGAFFAIYTGKQRAWVGVQAIGTDSTGDKPLSIGWKPQALFAVGTGIQTVNTIASSPGQAAHVSVGACRTGSAGQVAFEAEDAVGTSDTRSLASTKLIVIPDDAGTINWSAVLTSFDAAGATVNVDDAGSSCFALFFALEEDRFGRDWLPEIVRRRHRTMVWGPQGQ